MKIGLVCPGSGMKGIYCTAVLDKFLEKNIEFDYCIALSSGSANAASFLAKQKGRNYRFYMQHSRNPEYMSVGNFLKTGSYFGLEYIYGYLTEVVDPLDYDTLAASKTEAKAVVTDCLTGGAKYFDFSRLKKGDSKIIQASSAVPGACKPVEIDGRFYCDGGVSDPIPIEKALNDGCDKIVIVTATQPNGDKAPEKLQWIYPLVLRKYPKIISLLKDRHIRYNEAARKIRELEKNGVAMVIAPSKQIKSTMVSKDPNTLQLLYDLGLDDGEKAVNAFEKFA